METIHEGFIGGYVGAAEKNLPQGCFEFSHTITRKRRDESTGRRGARPIGQAGLADEVTLVEGDHHGNLQCHEFAEETMIFFVTFPRSIEHQQRHLSGLLHITGYLDSLFFNLVVGVSNAGGVDQFDRHAGEDDVLFQPIPGNAGLGRHDGPGVSEQRVEEAGLAHVGDARNGQDGAIAIDATGFALPEEVKHLSVGLGRLAHQGFID